ncbi:MAG: creatininase family protein [Alphaproteobacteria bacterium]|jgi:creatinine amidohydrolase|nr:creatininase family protein [Alphaproteobacteria bacterium]MBT7941877.1 creatininase family protein [Alphaproteobacteria bacterium]
MRLQLCTWPEVEAYLKRSTGIIMPVGSTEQHGPNGFIGTDALCPELIAGAMAEVLDVMIAPTINVGMAQHHLGFPGSMALRPTTLIAVVRDMVKSLSLHGFDRFFFINGHGGNTPTLHAAFAEIYAERSFADAGGSEPQVRCELYNWWKTKDVSRIAEEEFGDAEGRHATPSEVSLTYYGYPEDAERVAKAPMTPERAPLGEIYDAEDYRRRFPDGRIGSDPSLATGEIGKRLLAGSAEELTAKYQAFLKED